MSYFECELRNSSDQPDGTFQIETGFFTTKQDDPGTRYLGWMWTLKRGKGEPSTGFLNGAELATYDRVKFAYIFKFNFDMTKGSEFRLQYIYSGITVRAVVTKDVKDNDRAEAIPIMITPPL